MFRTCLSQTSRCVASSSSTSLFHTSAARSAPRQLSRKALEELKTKRWEAARARKPSVILGTRAGEEHKWDKCDLARVLVNEAELASPPKRVPLDTSIGTIELPQQFAYGVTVSEAKLLFDKLPRLSAGQGLSEGTFSKELSDTLQKGEQRELKKANEFARAIDLRNADADGVQYENKRRIIAKFSTPENPFDPGRTEVQAALLTYRIRNLWSHLTNHKRDVGNRLGLRKLVHHRAKILKYLKRKHRQRYDMLLPRLALESESVEGELIV
ncbi:hypothetical protein D9758_009970 [Tetrapyrgos nigripes]|uniref:S15/NS1 RNA-binding domain-containing protein n=1 Tax=Tetrapyrgos nigripes TaxID=182062 RepID=A0A8H5CQS7_9AGAR|nr:hypothetical protein D9758_009970 [Tetrapyrgos nigripes]